MCTLLISESTEIDCDFVDLCAKETFDLSAKRSKRVQGSFWRRRALRLCLLQRALHSCNRALHSCNRALQPLQRAPYARTRALHSCNRALHSCNRALHSCKRALYSRKRALHSLQRALRLSFLQTSTSSKIALYFRRQEYKDWIHETQSPTSRCLRRLSKEAISSMFFPKRREKRDKGDKNETKVLQ